MMVEKGRKEDQISRSERNNTALPFDRDKDREKEQIMIKKMVRDVHPFIVIIIVSHSICSSTYTARSLIVLTVPVCVCTLGWKKYPSSILARKYVVRYLAQT